MESGVKVYTPPLLGDLVVVVRLGGDAGGACRRSNVGHCRRVDDADVENKYSTWHEGEDVAARLVALPPAAGRSLVLRAA